MLPEVLFESLPHTWEPTSLGEACKRGGGDIQTGPFGSQLHAADYVSQGIPSIMPQNIGDNRINENGIARITPEDTKRLTRYLVRTGDIVYSRRGDVVFITDNAVSRAMAVGQEIGRAKTLGKTVIPVVTPNVPSSELGCLSGTTYQKIDPENPGVALNAIRRAILEKKQSLETQKSMLFLAGGVLALFLLTSKE